MKQAAPFTPAQVRAAKVPLCPKRNDDKHDINLAPWQTKGAMVMTRIGAICPKCSHVIEEVEIEGDVP